MRAINHALTGAVIGVTVSSPWVALPAAFESHFVLDAIPHHDFAKRKFTTSSFKITLVIDTLLCGLLVASLILWHPQSWLQACICAFLAASPDFMWIPRYVRAQHGIVRKQRNNVLRFHSAIQWFEKPIGWVVEAIWLPLMVWLL